MAFIYEIVTGRLRDDSSEVIGIGYSGDPLHKNDATATSLRNEGPIPAGEWMVVGPPQETAEHGPYVLAIYPKPGTETFGRSGFLMHGDSVRAPGTASKGCIIMSRDVREKVWSSGDRDLQVVSQLEEK